LILHPTIATINRAIGNVSELKKVITPYFRQFPTTLINIALIGREFQDVFHATKKLSIEEISPFDVYIYHTMSFSFLQSFSIHQTLKTHTLAALHVCLKVANLCL